MIKEFDHTIDENAHQIWCIFQSSYAIEAKMLKAINFPPLNRTVSQFLISATKFYAFYDREIICGIIEIDHNNTLTHIQSLVVDPEYFRQGIASKLVTFVLSIYNSKIITVETGLKNIPAIKLYKSFDFKEKNQWDTDHGVRKISFEFTPNGV